MKPDWKDAPKGAKYLAQDSDGRWFWHFHAPWKVKQRMPHATINKHYAYASMAATFATQDSPNPNWKKTLESRPS
jgi:hypothetical protein